jgi:uncharacterized Tic20 family protein
MAWIICTFLTIFIGVPLAIMENAAVATHPTDNAIGIGILYLIIAFIEQILITLDTLIGTIVGTIKAYKTRPSQYLD